MPQLQSVVLTDRTPVTPVNRTYDPQDIKAGVGVAANGAVTPAGSERISVSNILSGTRYKGEVRLVLPVIQNETVNGIVRPVVVRTAYVTLQTSFDTSSSEQERNDALGLMASALGTGKVLINDALVKNQGIY